MLGLPAPAGVKQGCAGAWWDRGVDRYLPVNASDYADALAFVVRHRYGARPGLGRSGTSRTCPRP